MKHLPALLGLLVACNTPRQPIQPVLEGIVARYAEDPAGAVAALEALPDARDRMLAVEALALHHGASMHTADGCRGLQAEPLRRRCAEILDRAHLFSDRQAAPAVEPEDRPSLTCDERSSPALCARAAALEALSAGEPEPWRHCDGVPTPTLRHECAFELGEAIIRQRGIDGYALAASTCQQAGPFEPNCQDHLSAELARELVAESGGACLDLLGETLDAELSAGVIAAYWQRDEPERAARLVFHLAEVMVRESVLAKRELPVVPVEGPPPYERQQISLARYATGGLAAPTLAAGPGADPERVHAARLAGLAMVLGLMRADVVVVEQLEDPKSLEGLRRVIDCYGPFAYPYLQLSPPARRAGVLSRYPLSVIPDGVGVQTRERSPWELTLAWGAPGQPFTWQSEAWQPAPGSPPEPRAFSLPFMVDAQGQPMPWNPAAKRGYSDQLPELVVLARAAGSPH